MARMFTGRWQNLLWDPIPVRRWRWMWLDVGPLEGQSIKFRSSLWQESLLVRSRCPVSNRSDGIQVVEVAGHRFIFLKVATILDLKERKPECLPRNIRVAFDPQREEKFKAEVVDSPAADVQEGWCRNWRAAVHSLHQTVSLFVHLAQAPSLRLTHTHTHKVNRTSQMRRLLLMCVWTAGTWPKTWMNVCLWLDSSQLGA